MSSKTTKLIVLSELERTLLTLLYSRSLYGTEFVEAIKTLSDGERDLKFGSLYPTLSRMEDKKYVTCRWGDETSGPRRKYYDITAYGKEQVEKDFNFNTRCWAFTQEQQEPPDASVHKEPKPSLAKNPRG